MTRHERAILCSPHRWHHKLRRETWHMELTSAEQISLVGVSWCLLQMPGMTKALALLLLLPTQPDCVEDDVLAADYALRAFVYMAAAGSTGERNSPSEWILHMDPAPSQGFAASCHPLMQRSGDGGVVLESHRLKSF